jgi:uridylate kinase
MVSQGTGRQRNENSTANGFKMESIVNHKKRRADRHLEKGRIVTFEGWNWKSILTTDTALFY